MAAAACTSAFATARPVLAASSARRASTSSSSASSASAAPLRRSGALRVSAAAGDTSSSSSAAATAPDEFYEITLPKPVEIKFARGVDGGAYAVSIPPDPKYDSFEIGDKITKVSASFGNEIWEADSYGQVIYAMKNRNGDIYLQMKRMNGDLSALDFTEKNSGFKSERGAGNYGSGTKEQQMSNYSKKKELEVQRLDMFDEAIQLYNKGEFDDALIIFEEVVALEPKNFMGDNFDMFTEIYKVSQYNIACCFSKLNQMDNSLQALKKCMGAGWKDFRKIRTDPSLVNVQSYPKFKMLLDKFDEPLVNQNAINFVKGMFGGKK